MNLFKDGLEEALTFYSDYLTHISSRGEPAPLKTFKMDGPRKEGRYHLLELIALLYDEGRFSFDDERRLGFNNFDKIVRGESVDSSLYCLDTLSIIGQLCHKKCDYCYNDEGEHVCVIIKSDGYEFLAPPTASWVVAERKDTRLSFYALSVPEQCAYFRVIEIIKEL